MFVKCEEDNVAIFVLGEGQSCVCVTLRRPEEENLNETNERCHHGNRSSPDYTERIT